jgi:uncharacterized protein YjbI with pentapeptide repeats
MISDSLQSEIWQRLLRGTSLDDLSLPRKEGRIDLRGWQLPEPKVIASWETKLAHVTQVEPDRIFRHAEWRNLDFSNSTLNSLQFYDSDITNCRFEKCYLRNFQPFASSIRDSSFKGAHLRGAGLGIATDEGPLKLRRNVFTRVDFSEADLRDSLYISAAFEGCIFHNARIVKVNFASSTFVDCEFEGELREVQFWKSDLMTRPWYSHDAFPVNEMRNVDFSRARLRDVEFRGIDLQNVKLPIDHEHIVIQDFAATLDRLIAALRKDGDQTAKILVAGFEINRKWAAPHSLGLLNRQDLADVGEDAVERVLSLLSQFEQTVN